jgi:hypothetical protein
MGRKVIQISFKDDEMELYYKIQMRCKVLSKSGWIKEAIFEKLDKEDNPSSFMFNDMPIINVPPTSKLQVKNIDSFLNF